MERRRCRIPRGKAAPAFSPGLKPLRPKVRPYMPMTEVTVIRRTSYQAASIRSMSGLRAKMKGMMNPPMASRVALTPVFMGLPPEMAEPA